MTCPQLKTKESMTPITQICKKKFKKFQNLSQSIFKTHSFFKRETESFALVFMALKVLARGKGCAYTHREDVAALAGVSVSTVSRCTSRMYNYGILSIQTRRTSNGHSHNSYYFSNVFKLSKIKKKIFSAIKYSLSEYVTLLKEFLVSLFKNMYKIHSSSVRYSLFNHYLSCRKKYFKFSNAPPSRNLQIENRIFKFSKKLGEEERRTMSNRISGVIERKLKFLNLTRAGKIRLTVFEDKVIHKAVSLYQRTYLSIPQDPFNAFFGACVYESKRLKQDVRWNKPKSFPYFDENGDVTLKGEKFSVKKCSKIISESYRKTKKTRVVKEWEPPNDPARENINPADELEAAIKSGKLDRSGLMFLRTAYASDPKMCRIIQAHLDSRLQK